LSQRCIFKITQRKNRSQDQNLRKQRKRSIARACAIGLIAPAIVRNAKTATTATVLATVAMIAGETRAVFVDQTVIVIVKIHRIAEMNVMIVKTANRVSG
jgi:hypothetical protein